MCRGHRRYGSWIPIPAWECPEGVIGKCGCTATMSRLGTGANRDETGATLDAGLVNPSIGTPQGPWLRTGDLGAFSDGELYIMGRLKDLVVVDGHNHFPDDIEATVREITGGRVAAIAIPKVGTEQLVIIAELKSRCVSRAEDELEFRTAKRDVASVVSATHGLHVADLVGVEPGSIPITSSGKIGGPPASSVTSTANSRARTSRHDCRHS